MKGLGVKWVKQIDHTYDVGHLKETLTEALTTPETGPKVIIASSECMLNKQRRERPARQAAIKGGERVVVPRFGVDEDVCTGDHACMRLSGCPSLLVKSLDDPLRDAPSPPSTKAASAAAIAARWRRRLCSAPRSTGWISCAIQASGSASPPG